MFILDRLLVGSLRFVLDKVAQAADQEQNDEEHLRQSLLEAQLELESGQLSEGEFKVREQKLLACLREARRQRAGQEEPISLKGKRAIVDASVESDED